MTRKKSPTLLPGVPDLHVVRLEADEQSILAIVATTSSGALCPLCQCCSESIHSRYTRVVADLPWAGRAVRLELHVRRFFCQNQECKRQIFTERLPEVVAPSARRTTRLCDLLTLIGFAMGGEAGNCLVERMGLEASPETLLGWFASRKSVRCPRLGCWALMIFVFAAAGAMERSSSISNDRFPSTCFPTGKLRPSKSGCWPILV